MARIVVIDTLSNQIYEDCFNLYKYENYIHFSFVDDKKQNYKLFENYCKICKLQFQTQVVFGKDVNCNIPKSLSDYMISEETYNEYRMNFYKDYCEKNKKYFSKIAFARGAAELSQAKMSELLKIPKRTIENWESGTSKPPEYVETLIVEKLLNIETEKKSR